MPKYLHPKCPICGEVMRADNPRLAKDGSITRRRLCPNGHRFKTAERIVRVLRGAEELIHDGRRAAMAGADADDGDGDE